MARLIASVRPPLELAHRLDVAVYAAIAGLPPSHLDGAMRRVSRAANYSRLWMGAAAVIALVRGRAGRRAAADGLAAVALASFVANAGAKPLSRRRRPDPVARDVGRARHVRMPLSHSFPSGHSASAFAFATGVAATRPRIGRILRVLAALVAYSRVHTGVHYPGDVVAGSLLGAALARLLSRARR